MVLIIWFLSFNLLIDLHIVKNPCIPGINPTWSWCMSFLMCCWILLAGILLRILHLCSSVILACSFLFVCCLCLVLVSGWWWPCRMSLEVFLPQFFWKSFRKISIAAAAAKSLQSCPTLCDPIDVSPPGSPVPGILQARTLEWVAISFSNAWRWKVKVKLLSPVQLWATPWTAAYWAPPPVGFSRQEYWSGVPSPSPPLFLRSACKSFTCHAFSHLCTNTQSSVSRMASCLLFT